MVSPALNTLTYLKIQKINENNLFEISKLEYYSEEDYKKTFFNPFVVIVTDVSSTMTNFRSQKNAVKFLLGAKG